MTSLASVAGLVRSVAIYHARPGRIAHLARFYREFVRDGDLAFDIGAHVGNRSLALAKAGARVVALEPQDLFYRFLRRFMPASVTVLPLAAGPPAVTEARLAVSRLHPTVSSLAKGFDKIGRNDASFAHVNWDTAQHVRVTTLDRLVEEFGLPAFVKIDVEGFEDQVLAGLTRAVPALSFEYLPATRDVTAACVERLAGLGRYEFNLVRGEGSRLELDHWVGGAEALARLAGAARPGDVYARVAP
jgi:FkbM family methyltransferase